jgi:hypothetical protein
LQPDSQPDLQEPRYGILGDPRELARRAAEAEFENALVAAQIQGRLWVPEQKYLQ